MSFLHKGNVKINQEICSSKFDLLGKIRNPFPPLSIYELKTVTFPTKTCAECSTSGFLVNYEGGEGSEREVDVFKMLAGVGRCYYHGTKYTLHGWANNFHQF